MKFKFTLYFVFVLANFSYSQTLTILDSETKKPLSNVFVYNDEQTKVELSNGEGNVDLSVFEDDEDVMIGHVSYQFVYFTKKALVKKGGEIYLIKTSDLLPEVVLSVSNSKTSLVRIAEQISVVTSKNIQELSPQTTPDLLANAPGITVQKSQLGGGSPTIRGFEANRVLLVVDGVRMNNAIYRSGHLQNSLTVDASNLERAEIIYGPSSIKYGSDALGGVIHFYTKRPKLGRKSWEANAKTSFSSADEGLMLHADAIYNNQKFGNFTSISYGNYSDLKMGKVRTHGFNDWGKVYNYSSNTEHFYTNDETDNSNPNIQKNTGYSQLDLLQKLIFKLNKTNELELNFQYSTSSNIPRFDALTDTKNGKLKWAEWYYGPQDRLLVSSSLISDFDKKWLSKSKIIIAYQNLKESRIQRKFGDLEKTFRNENVNLISLNADFSSTVEGYELSYGTEITHNIVSSAAEGKTLIVSGNEVLGFDNPFVVQSRYPDGGSDYSSLAFYAEARKNLSVNSTINVGLRFSNTLMHAKWEDETFIKLPQNNITLYNNALTGNLGYTYRPNFKWVLKGHFSTAFRSPNIDDIGKIREKRGMLTVPNTSLRPEYALNAEVNISRYLFKKKLVVSTDLFYTRIVDYIMRSPYQLVSGKDSLMYDGELAKTIANVNSGQAYVYGINIGVLAKLNSHLSLQSFLTYTKGRVVEQDLPMPSIPPLFGSTTLKFKYNKWMVILNSAYNSRKKAEDFDVYGGVDNLDKAASVKYGSPGWYTINTGVTYTFNKNLNLQLKVDNILDHHYMTFASGISARGRNFMLTFRGSI